MRSGEKVTVEIQVRVTGEVFSGGLLDQQLVTIAVEAEATHIPDGIDVDVDGMEIGTAVHAKDLALPDGTTLRPTRTRWSCTCSATRPAKIEAEGEAAPRGRGRRAGRGRAE